MKKISLLLVALMLMSVLAGCAKKDDKKPDAPASQSGESKDTSGKTEIEKLSVAFVPSRDPDEIVTATEPLKDLLKKELATRGFDVKEVDITVGTSYEAVGEGMAAGSIDVGFIPGGTYVLYDDAVDVILTATRKGLSIDSDDPKVWNENKPTKQTDEQVTFYRALFVAGPSEKGRAIAEKVNKGEDVTWDDLSDLNWSVMGSSSSSGYIYPYLYLQKKYGKGLMDLPNVVQADSYGSSYARLASEQVDVLVCYADARLDNVEKWTNEFGRKASIWDETNVIAVGDKIYNDTISVSKTSKTMTDELKKALTDAFIAIGNSAEGKAVIKIYNHDGYKPAQSSDYDGEREAQKLLKEMKSK